MLLDPFEPDATRKFYVLRCKAAWRRRDERRPGATGGAVSPCRPRIPRRRIDAVVVIGSPSHSRPMAFATNLHLHHARIEPRGGVFSSHLRTGAARRIGGIVALK